MPLPPENENSPPPGGGGGTNPPPPGGGDEPPFGGGTNQDWKDTGDIGMDVAQITLGAEGGTNPNPFEPPTAADVLGAGAIKSEYADFFAEFDQDRYNRIREQANQQIGAVRQGTQNSLFDLASKGRSLQSRGGFAGSGAINRAMSMRRNRLTGGAEQQIGETQLGMKSEQEDFVRSYEDQVRDTLMTLIQTGAEKEEILSPQVDFGWDIDFGGGGHGGDGDKDFAPGSLGI